MNAIHPFSTPHGPEGSERPYPLLSAARQTCINGFGSIDAAGSWLGMAPRVLASQLNNADRHKLGLVHAYLLSVAAHDAAIPKAWCADLGLATVKIPAIGAIGDVSLMCSFSAFIKEMGDVCDRFNKTMADNRVERHEVLAMRKEALELIEALMVLIARLEALQE